MLVHKSEKEERGPGAGLPSEPELAAKDDTGDEPKSSAEDKLELKQQPDIESALPEECADEVGAFFSVVIFLVDAMGMPVWR